MSAVAPVWTKAWRPVLVGLLAVLPYLNSLGGDFTFDDVPVIRNNAGVQREPPLRQLTALYPLGGLYRPLTMLTYALNARGWPAPFGYHAVNLALHVMVSLCAYFLALRLLRNPAAAIAAGVLFAVHPIHTEAVSSIVGRAELLAALGVMIALLAFARAQDAGGGGPWRALSLVAFGAGVLSKESALTGIGLLAVLSWRLAPQTGVRRTATALLPYAAVGAAYLVLRAAVVGFGRIQEPPGWLDNPLAHVDAATRIRTACIVLWEYVALLLAPINLSADYSFNEIRLASDPADPRFLGAAAVLTLAALAAGIAVRRAPDLAAGMLFFALPLALTSNVLFPIGTIKGERLLYLSSFGGCLAAGWLFAAAARHRRAAATAALILVTAGYAARTWARNADWRDERTLFAATVATVPDSAKAHHNLAVALQQAGDLDGAMAHYRQALALYPEYASAAFGIGRVYSLKEIDSGAVHWYEEALRLDWRFEKAHLQLGMIRQRHGEYDVAEAAFLSGLQSRPDDPLLLVNLGAARLAQGERWGAWRVLGRLDAVPVEPDVTELVAAGRWELEVALQ